MGRLGRRKLRGDVQSIRLSCPARSLRPSISHWHVFGYEFIDYHCWESCYAVSLTTIIDNVGGGGEIGEERGQSRRWNKTYCTYTYMPVVGVASGNRMRNCFQVLSQSSSTLQAERDLGNNFV
jgi:hypothetical protein